MIISELRLLLKMCSLDKDYFQIKLNLFGIIIKACLACFHEGKNPDMRLAQMQHGFEQKNTINALILGIIDTKPLN